MKPLEDYLRALHDIRFSGSGTQETSYYPPLSNLLNEIGKTLKPKVRCIMPLRNQGAGFPDGGFFTSDQFQRVSSAEPLPEQLPSRGVIEVKGIGDDVWKVIKSEQVGRYFERYRQVLVTNYRNFVLVGQDPDGNRTTLETYRFAGSELDFWALTVNPHKTAKEQGERFTEFLKRVMLHAAPLAKNQDVAWFLASYARDARVRIQQRELPALEAVRTALENAVGIKFEGEKGEDFFRSTLIQTLFYGVFAAWVLWNKQPNAPRFDWRMAAWSLRVPMIKALFEQVATPTKLGPLGLVEVLDWTGAMLNRVDRTAFFKEFQEEYAVQYFYEPFLQAFDPKLRKDLGVWYTPPEIVKYMVARVDAVLREELDLPDGLADPRVHVLDPCCGTGAYLVEVLKRIAQTIEERGDDALSGDDVKRAAIERVFGFEIIPAPFVIAHLQLGLVLQNLGAPLADEGERVGIYLTNALTGWEPPKEDAVGQLLMNFPELMQERDAADKVKRSGKILVVLGNPPYNAFAGVSPEDEQGLVETYKQGLISEWGIKKFNLDDLYVRFFRLAERCIAEFGEQRGVVCYISNHSWVNEPSFVVLRQHLLKSFDRFWIENMHGNRKISEYAPDGRTSETIFAIPGFSPGIRQGVVTSLWVKSGKQDEKPQVLYNDNINAAKAVERRTQLLSSLQANDFDAQYEVAAPSRSNRYSFRPMAVSADYLSWAKLVDLCAEAPSNGLMEKRGGALIDIDREKLEERMRAYLDSELDWEVYKALGYGLTEKFARFDPKLSREKLLEAEKFNSERVVRYALRPFETRWCYYTGVRPIWNEPRPALWEQCWEGNGFLMSRPAGVANPEGIPFYFTRVLGDNDFQRGHAYYFPLRLRRKPSKRTGQSVLFAEVSAVAGSIPTWAS